MSFQVLRTATLLKNGSNTDLFQWTLKKKIKNTYFVEHLQVAASKLVRY